MEASIERALTVTMRDQLYRAVGIGPPIAEPRRDLPDASFFN